MPDKREELDDHANLIPHFATRAEIADLREKILSLQAIVRAIAVKSGADGQKLEDWALKVAQFNAEPGRAIATAQEVVGSIAAHAAHAGK